MSKPPPISFPVPVPEWHTQRLHLKPLEETDLPALQQLRSNVLAMRYLDRPLTYTMEDARDLWNRGKKMEEEKTGFQLGIFLKETGEMVGTIGFFRMDAANAKTETGYMIHPSHWRKGYATEALKCLLEFGFKEMGFHRIEADINPENAASIALCRKLGFQLEAHLRQNFWYDGRFVDTVLMGILKSDCRP